MSVLGRHKQHSMTLPFHDGWHHQSSFVPPDVLSSIRALDGQSVLAGSATPAIPRVSAVTVLGTGFIFHHLNVEVSVLAV